VLTMPATLLPGVKADLYSKVSGYSLEVAVDIGDSVRKGDELLTIDVPEMHDELRQAEAVLAAKESKAVALQAKVAQAESMIATAQANLKQAQAQYNLQALTRDRKASLWKQKAISDQDHDEAQSHFAIAEAMRDIARARVANAEAELQAMEADVQVGRSEVAVEQAKLARLKTLMGYATIRAPFDGIITARMVDPGAFVRSAADGSTSPLLTVAHVAYLRLMLEVPESDASFVHKGTNVTISVKSIGGTPFDAIITRTAASLKPNTGTMRVEIDLQNKAGRLAPGMYARVTVILERKPQTLVVPSKAIRVRDRDLSVLVARDGIVRKQPVRIGYDDGIWAEVLEGLSGDEQVIISATSAVAPGAPVKAVAVGSS